MTLRDLVGTWEKTTSSRCSEVYPDRLVIQENGIYSGQKDPPGTFTTWDAGKVTVVGDGRAAISTANDAVITYEVASSGDTMTFVDPDRCRFAYRRVRR